MKQGLPARISHRAAGQYQNKPDNKALVAYSVFERILHRVPRFSQPAIATAMASIEKYSTRRNLAPKTPNPCKKCWSGVWYSLMISLAGILPANAGLIAIIIDDIGYNYSAGKQLVNLHPNLTLSILPDSESAIRLSDYALEKNREIMLHIPMQAANRHRASERNTLHIDLNESQFKSRVANYLERFPNVSGVNNHMGSLLTRHPGHMSWLMEVLSENPSLYFVDSRTHAATVAAQIAQDYAIPHSQRDVFLDNNQQSRDAIRQQMRRLGKLAKKQGFALAIGHPHKNTIAVLREEIPRLIQQGHTLVKVSEYIASKENEICPECSSLLLLAAKNSKPLPLSTCCAEQKLTSPPPD